MKYDLEDINPKTTLRFVDSNPHPKNALRYMADILLKYGNQKHNDLIARGLRIAMEHPNCTTRKDREYPALVQLSSMVSAIDEIAGEIGLHFVSCDWDGYVLYQFQDREN